MCKLIYSLIFMVTTAVSVGCAKGDGSSSHVATKDELKQMNDAQLKARTASNLKNLVGVEFNRIQDDTAFQGIAALSVVFAEQGGAPVYKIKVNGNDEVERTDEGYVTINTDSDQLHHVRMGVTAKATFLTDGSDNAAQLQTISCVQLIFNKELPVVKDLRIPPRPIYVCR